MRSRFAALTALLLVAVSLMAGSAVADDAGGVSPGDPKPGADAGWVRASAAGVSMKATVNALGGGLHTVSGSVARGRRNVVLERQVSDTTWKALAYGRSAASGSYALSWKVAVYGHIKLRVRATGLTGAPSGTVTAYHRAKATIFGGPGEYQDGACGGRIEKGTLGVAHKTLPCGTLVQISVGNRVMVLPVVDRGPYRAGYDWDVTFDAATVLKMDGLATVGYVILGRDGM